MAKYEAMPDEDGDFTLVRFDAFGKPSCIKHGAMNKLSESPPERDRDMALYHDERWRLPRADGWMSRGMQRGTRLIVAGQGTLPA